jgi:hypothetical protein
MNNTRRDAATNNNAGDGRWFAVALNNTNKQGQHRSRTNRTTITYVTRAKTPVAAIAAAAVVAAVVVHCCFCRGSPCFGHPMGRSHFERPCVAIAATLHHDSSHDSSGNNTARETNTIR